VEGQNWLGNGCEKSNLRFILLVKVLDMSRISIILFSIFFLQLSVVNAQHFTVAVKLLTDENIPINYCVIKLKGTSHSFTSNKSGSIYFNSTIISESTFKLVCNDLRFEPYEREFERKANNFTNDTLNIKIELGPLVLVGPDIYSKPQIVYQNKKLNVQDFEFVGENILLLTYEKRPGHNTRLVLTDEKNTVISSYFLDNDANKMEKDYEGKIHVIASESVFGVTVYENQIYLLKEDKTAYENFLKPLIHKDDEQIYFSNYSWHYPAFTYYAFNTTDSTYKNLKYIEDKFMMGMYRAEYKYVDTRTKLEASRMQQRTGIDKEIWAAVWNGFPNSLYYKPVYAPMFARNDSVLLFDHYSNQLFYFDDENNLLDSVSINYHLGKEASNWKKQLIMDDISEKIYNIFEKNGTYMLVELNVLGQAVSTVNLQYKYPEKIKIHNGYVYFNYRPFESLQNKYLYKQALK
jgi:hypothetical protein